MESSKTQAVAKTLYCSPHIDSKVPLQKTKPTQFIERREIELVPTQNLRWIILVSLVQKILLSMLPKENHVNQPSRKTFDLQCCSDCKIC